MGDLRDRMVQDLTLAGYSPSTIRIYLHYGKSFAKHFMRSPADMGEHEVREYLLHLLDERKLSHDAYRQAHAAIKFLYMVTLARPLEVQTIPRHRCQRPLPDILSGTEVQALLSAVKSPKYRLLLMTVYAAGLRISEACRLRVGDIDSKRGVIHVRLGKGRQGSLRHARRQTSPRPVRLLEGLNVDGSRWVPTSPTFFLPVKVLGSLFRGKFLHALADARRRNQLDLNGSTAHLKLEPAWRTLLDTLYRTDWVVYAKRPFAGPEQVYRYLGHYTHRVAISNHRLVATDGQRISFKVRDYADGGKKKTLTLDAVEFIRRFLIHVLPKKFVRIRHYGLLAGRNIFTKLAHARDLVTPTPSEPPPTESPRSSPWWERLLALTGIDVFACPYCEIGRLLQSSLPRPLSVGFIAVRAP